MLATPIKVDDQKSDCVSADGLKDSGPTTKLRKQSPTECHGLRNKQRRKQSIPADCHLRQMFPDGLVSSMTSAVPPAPLFRRIRPGSRDVVVLYCCGHHRRRGRLAPTLKLIRPFIASRFFSTVQSTKQLLATDPKVDSTDAQWPVAAD
jgi:hypothetical protein